MTRQREPAGPVPPPTARRLRQADIARLAGVSQPTVSLVVNGRASAHHIAPETQQRVLDAVRQLGYVVDPVARRLAGGGTRLLAVFGFEPVLESDFYFPFLAGIEEEAARLGYDLVLFTSATGGARSIYRDGVNRLRLTDGAVLLGLSPDRSELTRLRAEGFPYLHVGRRETDESDIPFVAADYASATERVVEYLRGLGHRSLGYLAPVTEDEPTSDREQGFHRAVRRLGVTVGGVVRHPADGPTTSDVFRLRRQGVTAFVTHYAAHALAIRDMLALHGIAVPRDCSLVALDEPPPPDGGTPSLTGFHIPRRDMGAHAVRTLVRQIESGVEPEPAGVCQICLPCQLAPGGTCAPPPSPETPAATPRKAR